MKLHDSFWVHQVADGSPAAVHVSTDRRSEVVLFGGPFPLSGPLSVPLGKEFTVTLKPNIGTSEITWKALTSGQIQMYPEYTGTLLSAIAGQTALPTSADQAYTQAKTYAEKHGFTLLNRTPFTDSDAIGTRVAFAKKYGLVTDADLKKLGHSLTLGGAPEFATRQEGLLGLEKVYGLNPTFKPIAIGLTYKALDSGQVEVTDVFTTDPQLTTGKDKPVRHKAEPAIAVRTSRR